MPISADLVDRALTELHRSEMSRAYFFEKADDSEWIEPLLQHGFFSEPPQPHRDGNMISFPRWPAAGYLARMASAKPGLVRRVIQQAKLADNPRVHDDYLKAALAMPTTEAVELVRNVKDWIAQPQYPFTAVAQHVAELSARLAAEGYMDQALELMVLTLAVVPGPPRGLPEDDPYYTPPDPLPRFQIFEYEAILREQVPNLVAAAGVPALAMLCDLLDHALDLDRRPGSAPEDLSVIWRPAIEDHEQNLPHQLLGLLVEAERNAAQTLVELRKVTLEQLGDLLERRRWKVHRRILLHVLAEAGDQDPTSLERIATRREYLDGPGFQHEFARMLKRFFGHLSAGGRQAVLEHVKAGPDTGWMIRFHEREGLPGSVEEYINRSVAHWQWERLSPIADQLPGGWHRLYEQLKETFGEPDPEHLVHRTISWTGPTSPKSTAELAELTNEDLVAYLNEWLPPHEPMSPSREGLARELQALAAENPERFSRSAPLFQIKEPTYVRSLLMGWRDAADAGKRLDWEGALKLCSWALNQDDTKLPDRSPVFEDGDSDWTQARIEAARLLGAALGDSETSLRVELADDAWAVIERLANDQHPTPEDEATSSSPNMGPATYALNCVRGQALQDVVRFALWNARRRGLLAPNGEVSSCFSELPEVKEVLERHLGADHDRSPAVRSVYGQYFPYLALLDLGWAKANAAQIFPDADRLREYWDAAWDTYVIFSRPYSNVFPALRHQYETAITRLRHSEGNVEPHRADSSLAEHVLALYLQKDVEVGDPLVVEFFARARLALRRYVLFEAGHLLRTLKGQMPEGLLERLIALWEWRLQTVNQVPGKEAATELEPFGWWFASARLPEEWSLGQLEALLEQGVLPDPDHLVAERLATLGERWPARALQAMRLMVRLSRDPWKAMGWVQQARSLIRAGAGSNEPVARDLARMLTNELGARGISDVRDLASSPS